MLLQNAIITWSPFTWENRKNMLATMSQKDFITVNISIAKYLVKDYCLRSLQVNTAIYCLTKISIRAKRSISRVFSLFIVPSPFFVHCPYKGRINRTESVLTGLKPY